MSRSSLYLIDEGYIGCEDKEYKNSWLLSPIVWDILMEKYLKKYNRSAFIENGNKPIGFMSAMMFHENAGINTQLNNIINDCQCQADRVLWELSNQQVFFSKDKEFVSNCIVEFIKKNASYYNNLQEHIIERFHELSKDIRDIDTTTYPLFVFKNTGVDDNVQYWFVDHDEETDDYKSKSLKDWDKQICEFVLIKNERIVGFKDNLDYFKSL